MKAATIQEHRNRPWTRQRFLELLPHRPGHRHRQRGVERTQFPLHQPGETGRVARRPRDHGAWKQA
jgi:hypothetical protein